MQVKAKSKKMSDLKAYLDAERARLQREIASSRPSTDQRRAGYGNHMADHATAVFEQAKNVGLRRSHELLLADVVDALRRMDDGSYGICRHCGQAIDLARLRAQPAASLCLSCQGHLESRKHCPMETREGARLHRGRVRWPGVFLFAVGLLVAGLDQYTKCLVRRSLPLNSSWNPIAWLSPIVTLTHIRNTGAAFGLLPDLGALLAVVSLVVVVGIIIYYRRLAEGSWMLRLAFGLQLGGAVGNLIDRVCFGYVTDFVDLRVWPVFNVADSAVVVGTILLAVYALFLDPGGEGDPEPANEVQAGAAGDG